MKRLLFCFLVSLMLSACQDKGDSSKTTNSDDDSISIATPPPSPDIQPTGSRSDGQARIISDYTALVSTAGNDGLHLMRLAESDPDMTSAMPASSSPTQGAVAATGSIESIQGAVQNVIGAQPESQPSSSTASSDTKPQPDTAIASDDQQASQALDAASFDVEKINEQIEQSTEQANKILNMDKTLPPEQTSTIEPPRASTPESTQIAPEEPSAPDAASSSPQPAMKNDDTVPEDAPQGPSLTEDAKIIAAPVAEEPAQNSSEEFFQQLPTPVNLN